jgi:hypothetical protein
MDCVFREDDSPVSVGHAPESLAVFRPLAQLSAALKALQKREYFKLLVA